MQARMKYGVGRDVVCVCAVVRRCRVGEVLPASLGVKWRSIDSR
jgi:hypothetical protein